jgi:hypothetical protein
MYNPRIKNEDNMSGHKDFPQVTIRLEHFGQRDSSWMCSSPTESQYLFAGDSFQLLNCDELPHPQPTVFSLCDKDSKRPEGAALGLACLPHSQQLLVVTSTHYFLYDQKQLTPQEKNPSVSCSQQFKLGDSKQETTPAHIHVMPDEKHFCIARLNSSTVVFEDILGESKTQTIKLKKPIIFSAAVDPHYLALVCENQILVYDTRQPDFLNKKPLFDIPMPHCTGLYVAKGGTLWAITQTAAKYPTHDLLAVFEFNPNHHEPLTLLKKDIFNLIGRRPVISGSRLFYFPHQQGFIASYHALENHEFILKNFCALCLFSTCTGLYYSDSKKLQHLPHDLTLLRDVVSKETPFPATLVSIVLQYAPYINRAECTPLTPQQKLENIKKQLQAVINGADDKLKQELNSLLPLLQNDVSFSEKIQQFPTLNALVPIAKKGWWNGSKQTELEDTIADLLQMLKDLEKKTVALRVC